MTYSSSFAIALLGKSKGTAKRTPALLTRTAEERQRIITEKVAMILMEEVASGEDTGSKEINVQSTFLQECVDVVCMKVSKNGCQVILTGIMERTLLIFRKELCG